MRSRLALALPALLLFLASSACNTPHREAHDGAATPASPQLAATPASASALAPAPLPAAPPASSGSCTSDEDCRTFSSYCAEAPCACRVVGARDPAPKCLGASPSSNVRCFADPCMNKAARCQGGACVLTAK